MIRDIDEYTRYINYEWTYEECAEVVTVNLDAYNRWHDELDDDPYGDDSDHLTYLEDLEDDEYPCNSIWKW